MHHYSSAVLPLGPAAKASPPAKPVRERRIGRDLDPSDPKLRRGLTREQSTTLDALEAFRWRLAFVRRPMFMDPLPVLFARDNGRFVVINGDGSLDESQALKLRD